MEAFSMFKYWKGGGRGGGGGGGLGSNMRATPTTISTYPVSPTAESEEHNDDEGPFFDIEFALPDEENRDGEEDEEEEEEEEKGEQEFDFELSSAGSGGPTEPSLSLSPSDDLFFKGRLVPFEPFHSSEPNSKPQFPISLLKSATKFRVFLLGSRKPPKSESETPDASSAQKQQHQSKLFTVKFKVEEVPIVSLFTRDNSSRSSSSGAAKPQKQMSEESVSDEGGVASSRSSKDVLHKYLKMIKPLYVRASKRYGEKLKFSGQLSLGGGEPAIDEGREGGGGGGGGESASTGNILKNKQVNVPAGLRVVGKYLGKSRSASAAVGCVPPPPGLQSRRRDDSLLQQQDGIQGAILHCKRSFNACKDSERNSFSPPLCSSELEPSGEKSHNNQRS